jgi:hypothetical protein
VQGTTQRKKRNHKRERKGKNRRERGREKQEGKGSALYEKMNQEATVEFALAPQGGEGLGAGKKKKVAA